MKKILIFILGIISYFNVDAQAPLIPTVRCSLSTVTVFSDPYTVTGKTSDFSSNWQASDISAGDSLYLADGNELRIYRVVSISSASGVDFTIVIDDINDSGSLPVTGDYGVIYRGTTNHELPSFVAGISETLQMLIQNRFVQRLDALITSGNADYITTDSFTTFVPTTTFANIPIGKMVFRTTTGNYYQKTGVGTMTRRSYEDGQKCSTILGVTSNTLTFNANLNNRVTLNTLSSGTTMTISAPTNITSQAVGEVFQIGIANQNDSTVTINWNSVFGAFGNPSTAVVTTVPAGSTVNYLWQVVTNMSEGVVLTSLNDLGGGTTTGAIIGNANVTGDTLTGGFQKILLLNKAGNIATRNNGVTTQFNLPDGSEVLSTRAVASTGATLTPDLSAGYLFLHTVTGATVTVNNATNNASGRIRSKYQIAFKNSTGSSSIATFGTEYDKRDGSDLGAITIASGDSIALSFVVERRNGAYVLTSMDDLGGGGANTIFNTYDSLTVSTGGVKMDNGGTQNLFIGRRQNPSFYTQGDYGFLWNPLDALTIASTNNFMSFYDGSSPVAEWQTGFSSSSYNYGNRQKNSETHSINFSNGVNKKKVDHKMLQTGAVFNNILQSNWSNNAGNVYAQTQLFSGVDTTKNAGGTIIQASRRTYPSGSNNNRQMAAAFGTVNQYNVSTDTVLMSLHERTYAGVSWTPFKVEAKNDTSANTIKIYDKYYLPNLQPSTASGDTTLLGWAGDGAGGTTPIFLDKAAFGGGGGNTIYTGSDSLQNYETVVKMDASQRLYFGQFEDVTGNGPYSSNDVGLYVDKGWNGDVGMVNYDSRVNLFLSNWGSDGGWYFDAKSPTNYQGSQSLYAHLGNQMVSQSRLYRPSGKGFSRIMSVDTLTSSSYGDVWLGEITANSSLTYGVTAGVVGELHNDIRTAGDTASIFRVTRKTNGTAFNYLSIPLWTNTSTGHGVQLYNNKYQLPNAQPSVTLNDTTIMAWRGTGSATTPMFLNKNQFGGGGGNTVYTATDSIATNDQQVKVKKDSTFFIGYNDRNGFEDYWDNSVDGERLTGIFNSDNYWGGSGFIDTKSGLYYNGAESYPSGWQLNTSNDTSNYRVSLNLKHQDVGGNTLVLIGGAYAGVDFNYGLPASSPSVTSNAKSIMTWTGTGSATTSSFESLSAYFKNGANTLTAATSFNGSFAMRFGGTTALTDFKATVSDSVAFSGSTVNMTSSGATLITAGSTLTLFSSTNASITALNNITASSSNLLAISASDSTTVGTTTDKITFEESGDNIKTYTNSTLASTVNSSQEWGLKTAPLSGLALTVGGATRSNGKILSAGTGNSLATTASQVGFLNTNGNSTSDIILKDDGGLNVVSNTAVNLLELKNSDVKLGGRFQTLKGADVAAANDLTLGNVGNVFHITGATQVNAITTTNWQAGSEITLIFDSTPTVKNNTAGGGGTAVMLLSLGIDFSATANDVLKLVYDGTSWFEVSRSVN